MTTKTFSAPRPGPVTLAVHAGAAFLEAITGPQITSAAASVTGPAAVTRDTRAELSRDTWTLTLPRDDAPAGATAVSGAITVTRAAGAVDAQTTSGDVTVHTIAPVSVGAHTVSGDVRVTADTAVTPLVQAGSVSGRVTCPPAHCR